MTEFGMLNTGLSGLLAHRYASEVIGNNIANVNTDGFSRRRVNLRAEGNPVAAFWAGTRNVGDGVGIGSIERMRDEFLERRMLAESGEEKDLERLDATLRRIELVFPEPSDTAIAAKLQELWKGFGDLANSSHLVGTRSQALERSVTLAQTINTAGTDLVDLQRSGRENVAALVGDINGRVATIARLNKEIEVARGSGAEPNNLLDQRDQMILELSEMAQVTVRSAENGQVDVSIGGTQIVRGGSFDQLVVDQSLTPPTGTPTSDTGLPWTVLRWQKDGQPVQGVGGELGGLLTSVNETIPTYLRQLNDLARQIATDVNAIHTTGFDYNGNPGGDLFTYSGVAPAPASPAAGWAVNMRVGITDPLRLAASSTSANYNDGSIAAQIAAIGNRVNGPDAAYKAIIANLGVEAISVRESLEAQRNVVEQVDIERKAVSGVNLDEEMTNLLASQRAYEASARFVTTVDEMLDTLINRMAP
jgi:flagellar hook-associated protein 1